MTTNATPGRAVPCGRCSYLNEARDRFCARCGTQVVVTPPSPAPNRPGWAVPEQGLPHRPGPTQHRPGPAPRAEEHGPGPRATAQAGPAPSVPRDSTTRYLCAAAHLDAGFADAAIREYLVEHTRAVASSPGVDTAAVLREAVAARRRRKIRDAVLLGLLVVFALGSLPLLLVWAVVAIAAAAIGGGRRGTIAVAVVAVLALIVIGPFLLSFLALGLGIGVASVGGSAVAVIAGLLLTGVVLADEYAVDELTRHHFRPDRFQTDATGLASGWVRTMRTLGLDSWSGALARVADADRRGPVGAGDTELVVHRGKAPFVGSGVIVKDETIPLPLRPDDEQDEPEDGGADAAAFPQPFEVSELMEHVTRELLTLRKSGSLSPGRRLSALSAQEQVFVSAERLLRDRGHDLLPAVLPDLGAAPATRMPSGRAHRLADEPVEAARYYRCYRVEAWDRDLAISTYLNAGTDERMLYLEWTHCVLFPVPERFRSIDHPRSGGPVTRGLHAAIVFPVTVPERIASLCHWFRPIRQRSDEIVPDRYGAGASLRELASDANARTYFQEADTVRYIKILEQTMFRAVSEFLEERGYSIAEVMEVAQANITQVVLNNSVVSDSAVGIGRVRRSGGTAATGPTVQQKEKP